jgi:glycosyltransferase involved in cell wall biosynthesis
MVVSNGHPPDPRVQKEAEALNAAGYEVEIHAFDRHGNLKPKEEMNGIKIIRHTAGERKTPYGGTIRTALGLRKFRKSVIRELRQNQPDIIHCHDADTLSIGVALKRMGNCRLVFDMHDLHHTWVLMPAPRSIWRRIASRIMRKKMLRRAHAADLVITSSGQIKPDGHPGFREWLADRGIEAVVVENRPRLHNKPAPFPEKSTIGYLGTVREISMFRNLIDALMKIPKQERPAVRIAGGGTAEEAVALLFEQATEIESSTSADFASDEISSLMEDVSIMYCVYPTARGNIPEGALATKMFDAAAHGRASLVNSDCLMADLAKVEKFGMSITPNNPKELAKGIQKLLSNPPETKSIHGWTREAKKLVEAYKSLHHD